MSERLWIGDTLNEAFQFGLKRWGTVFRYSWATLVVAIIVFGAFAAVMINPGVFDGHKAAEDISQFQDILRMPVPIAIAVGVVAYAFIALLFCGVIASVFRLAALGEDRPGLIHLRIDGPAIRVFLSFLIIAALNGVIWVAALAASFAINGQDPGSLLSVGDRLFRLALSADAGETSDAEAFSALLAMIRPFALAGLIALIPLLYLNIKLIPFPAGSAAENRLLLFGSFSMTTGHFWSILGAYVLFIVFAIALSIVFELAMVVLRLIVGILAAMGVGAALVGVVFAGVGIAASVFFNVYLFGVQVALRAIVYRRLATGA